MSAIKENISDESSSILYTVKPASDDQIWKEENLYYDITAPKRPEISLKMVVT